MEVLTIGGLDDDLLYQWAGLATDEDGNIYVTDLKDYAVKKFSPQGVLIKKTGEKGRGPGEFDSPVIIKYFENHLYVTEIYVLGIHVFDRDLGFVKKIPLNHPVRGLVVLPAGRFAVSGLKDLDAEGSQYSIRFYDSAGKDDGKIVYETSDASDFMMHSVSFTLDDQENIWMAYSWIDRIRKMNKQGNTLIDKRLLGIGKPKMKKTELGNIPTQVVFKSIEPDRKGHLFVLGGHLSKNSSRDIYVLSQDGRLLTTLTLPEPTHMIHIDNRNYLYSRADEGISIKKYALKYLYE